jgi:cell division control protein 6
MSSATTQSFDTATSADPLDIIELGQSGDTDNDDDEDDDADAGGYFDIHRTPTKPKTRSATRYAVLPTPPSSSPFAAYKQSEVDATAKRMELIRMQSASSTASTAGSASSSSIVVRKRSRSASAPREEETPPVEDEEDTRHKNPYKQLKSFLRLSAAGSTTDGGVSQDCIIGRDTEKAILRSYLSSQERGVGMYVSGPPGTGKTALVTSLGRELQSQGWTVVELGFMGMKVMDVWKRLGEELSCGKTETDVRALLESGQGNT